MNGKFFLKIFFISKSRLGIGLFFACLISPVLIAQPNYQEDFLKANKLYKNGDFEQAYKLYEKIENKSAQVNYNLGNSAYKLGKHGYALLYWRRAERDWGFFNRGELLDNILLLKKKLYRGSDRKEKLFILYQTFKSYLRAVPLFIIQIFFLALWLFLFLYLRYLYKKKRKYLIVILFFFIAFLGGLLVFKYRLEFNRYGVVINKRVHLLSGPGKNFQELGVLFEASEIAILKSSDDFYKVRFNRQIGWISQKDVEKVN